MALLLASLMTGGWVSTAHAQGKLGPFLQRLVAEYERGGEAAATAMAEQRGMTLRTGPQGPLVPLIVEPLAGSTAAGIDRAGITARGGQVDAVSTSFMRVLAPFNLVGAMANLPDAKRVRAPIPALELDVGMGSSVSESVHLTGAAALQLNGTTGAGAKVAVVDLGFAYLDWAMAFFGEVPTDTVGVDFTGLGLMTGTEHGTGVAEHVMDMAPGAELYCIKIGDEVDLENAAAYIGANGIDIANHSVGWVNGSYYDDTGPIAQMINDSHEVDGVVWTVAAGNQARRHWRGAWSDADGDGWLNFAGGDETLELTSASSLSYIFLNWNQYGDSQTNLDLYIVDKRNRTVAQSRNRQNGPQDPAEDASFAYSSTSAPYSVKVRHRGGPTAGLDLTIFSFYNDLEYALAASSLMEPADASGAYTVAAINQADWNLADPPPESFSSQGPSNDGRAKPDIAAPDGTTSFVYGFQGSFGTSFSAPTCAGAAALLLELFPGSSADDLEDQLTLLANDIGAPGPDPVFGAGKLDLAAGPPGDPPPPNDAPVVTITSPADGSTFDSGAPIYFEGSAIDTEDGHVTANLIWVSDLYGGYPIGAIGGGASFTTVLGGGTHTITALVEDSGGTTGSASITITVLDPPAQPTDVTVSSVEYVTQGGRNQTKDLLIGVMLVDGTGNPVSGASVTIWLIGNINFYGEGTSTTGEDGKVWFVLKNAPSDTYTTVVISVAAAGLFWDGVTPENLFIK